VVRLRRSMASSGSPASRSSFARCAKPPKSPVHRFGRPFTLCCISTAKAREADGPHADPDDARSVDPSRSGRLRRSSYCLATADPAAGMTVAWTPTAGRLSGESGRCRGPGML
jgi:hypothetical protein